MLGKCQNPAKRWHFLQNTFLLPCNLLVYIVLWPAKRVLSIVNNYDYTLKNTGFIAGIRGLERGRRSRKPRKPVVTDKNLSINSEKSKYKYF